jgi:hypothetical protein
VSPKLDDVFSSFVEVLVCLVKSLEHFGDISHVEYVVTLGWSWQELLLYDIEDVDGGLG